MLTSTRLTAPKPPLCKGRCQPIRLTEGLSIPCRQTLPPGGRDALDDPRADVGIRPYKLFFDSLPNPVGNADRIFLRVKEVRYMCEQGSL